jgi:nucleotide-binding universal stress UspA family protein
MNTRGLMELVILTIGLDLGVISPAVFVMMVLMALITTFMTSPALEWIYPLEQIRRETIGAMESAADETILIPVSLPSSGPDLVAAARVLAPSPDARIYALHLARADDLDDARPADHEALKPLLRTAATLGATVRPLAFVSRSFGEDIAEVAKAKLARLILLGWHKPVLSESILSGTIQHVMAHASADVAVYVARRAPPWKRVLVPFARGPHDRAALELAGRLANGTTEITVLHVVAPGKPRDHGRAVEMGPEKMTLKVVECDDPIDALATEARTGYDLVIVGASDNWGLEPRLFGARHERVAEACAGSVMIVRRFGS